MQDSDHDTLQRAAQAVARNYGKKLWWADLRDLENEAWVGVLQAAATFDPRKATGGLFRWVYVSACQWMLMYAQRTGGPVAAPRGRKVGEGERAYTHVHKNAGPPTEPMLGSTARTAEQDLERAQVHALAERAVREALRRADPDGLAEPVLLGGKRPAEVAAERDLPVKRVYSATSAARAALRADGSLLRALRRIA